MPPTRWEVFYWKNMRTLEKTIYIPVIISETERPKWDPFQFNDAVDSEWGSGGAVEMVSGVSEYTSPFSDENALEAVRGELDAVMAVETSIDTSFLNGVSEYEGLLAEGDVDAGLSDNEIGGQEAEGFEGENDGSGEGDA